MLTFADEDGNIVMPKFDSNLAVSFSPGQRTVLRAIGRPYS
jgi:hypothetical protein